MVENNICSTSLLPKPNSEKNPRRITWQHGSVNTALDQSLQTADTKMHCSRMWRNAKMECNPSRNKCCAVVIYCMKKCVTSNVRFEAKRKVEDVHDKENWGLRQLNLREIKRKGQAMTLLPSRAFIGCPDLSQRSACPLFSQINGSYLSLLLSAEFFFRSICAYKRGNEWQFFLQR